MDSESKDKLAQAEPLLARTLFDGEMCLRFHVRKDKRADSSALNIRPAYNYLRQIRALGYLEGVLNSKNKKGTLNLEQAIPTIRDDFEQQPREIAKRLRVIAQEGDQRANELFYIKYVFPDDPRFVKPDYFEIWIDPNRGFFPVRVHWVRYYGHGRLFESLQKHIAYEQLEGRNWFPKSVKLIYESGDSVTSIVCDVSSARINCVPDDRLTLASLGIPIGTAVHDYTQGEPPTEYKYGSRPFQKDVDEIVDLYEKGMDAYHRGGHPTALGKLQACLNKYKSLKAQWPNDSHVAKLTDIAEDVKTVLEQIKKAKRKGGA